jgi:hypothetical protein
VAREPEKTGIACLRCARPLYSLGVHELRMGGVGGGWSFLFGGVADLGEEVVGMEFLACRSCGKVELRIPLENG